VRRPRPGRPPLPRFRPRVPHAKALPDALPPGPQRPIWDTLPQSGRRAARGTPPGPETSDRRHGAGARTVGLPPPTRTVQPARPGAPSGLAPGRRRPPAGSSLPNPARSHSRPCRCVRRAAAARVVAADVALHGFVYLGLLLTFVGLLGFLLFSFKDVPTDAQPVIEFAVPAVLFGWSWVLHRQRAVRVAQAMELLAGIVLPLVIFASLVDGAPFPPDAEGGALVVAMVAVCVVGAGGYAAWSGVRPDSTLRYLVHPMLWLGAMALGFVAKSDEPLLGDAITRLVSLQPALAAAAVAVSVAWVGWRPTTRLAAPTRVAALPGIVAAYGLTLGLAAGEGWTQLWPVVIAGAAALVTAELLAVQFARRGLLVALRPLLVVATSAPLVPIVGSVWAGIVVTVAFLTVGELELRRTPVTLSAVAVAAAGVVVGAALAMGEPWTGVAAWAAITLWTTVRQAIGTVEPTLVRPLAVAAGIAPVGLAGSLLVALPVDLAWVVVAGLLLVAAIGARWRGAAGAVWSVWSVWAAVVVALGVVISVDVLGIEGTSPTLLAVAAVCAATTVALARGAAAGRLWATSAILAIALALVLLDLPLAASSRAVVWGAASLLLVVAALRRRVVAGHLAAVGHLVALGAVALAAVDVLGEPAAERAVLAVVLVANTLGWAIAVVAQELGRPMVADLLRGPTPPEGEDGVPPTAWALIVRSFPAGLLLVSLPLAWLQSLALLPTVTARPAWVGAALAGLALAEALVARATAGWPALRPLLAPSAALVAVTAVVAGAPDLDVLLATALVAIATAGILGRRLAVVPFVWFAWLQSGLVVVLATERAGLRPVRLPSIVLLWASALLLGGLVLDGRLAGPRPVGGWLRRGWLRAPVVLGAFGLLLGYALLYVQAELGVDAAAPARFTWWSLGVGGTVLVVALQLHLAPLSGLTALLVSIGLARLSPWPVADHPWVLIGVAAALVAVAWLLDRLRSRTSSPAGAWDLPVLAVAHLVAAAGLARAVPTAAAETWLAGGALAAALALWRRHRAWAEASNGLLVAAAAALGAGWVTVAFAGTALRGIVSTTRAEGNVRWSYQAIGVLGAGAGWLSLSDWAGWSTPRAVVWSTLAAGSLAVAVALLRRTGRVAGDTAASWTGLAVVAETVTLVSIAAVLGDVRPVGVAPAIGIALLALAATLAAPVVSGWLHDVAAGLVVIAWLLAIAGTPWEVAAASMATTATFAVVALVVVERARRRAPTAAEPVPEPPLSVTPLRHLARTWFAIAAGGVAVGAVLTHGALERRPVLLVLGGALVVLAAAAARGPEALAWPLLRHTSGLLSVAATMVIALALGIEIGWLAMLVLAVGLAATLLALAAWQAAPTTIWLAPLITTGLTASLVAALLAVAGPSDPALVVVLAAVAAQAAAVGLVLQRPGVLALAPVLAVASWAVLLVELPVEGVVWTTVPVAAALLVEVDVARWWRRRLGQVPTSRELLTLELAAIGLAALPPLVELFTRGLALALVAVGLAAGLLLWAVVTRVRRRAVVAGALATATAVLTIAAAAAGQAPASAFVWIVTAGIGVTLLLVVALVEAARSRGGRGLRRLDELTADWE
jgi:hypothetical protein